MTASSPQRSKSKARSMPFTATWSQVKQHMLEVSPFDEVRFWAPQDAAEKIMERRSALRPEGQFRVRVFAVGEDGSV